MLRSRMMLCSASLRAMSRLRGLSTSVVAAQGPGVVTGVQHADLDLLTQDPPGGPIDDSLGQMARRVTATARSAKRGCAGQFNVDAGLQRQNPCTAGILRDVGA